MLKNIHKNPKPLVGGLKMVGRANLSKMLKTRLRLEA